MKLASLVALAALAAGPSVRPERTVTVKKVVDGDTLLVAGLPGTELVRLIGIDAPETGKGRTVRECFGAEAASWLEGFTPKGTSLRLVFDVGERDRFGRLLAYVYRSDGTFVNAEVVANGYAQTMTIPPNVRHEKMLLGLQRRARREEKGLWRACR
jgi:micrococcal nuclease